VALGRNFRGAGAWRTNFQMFND